MQGSSDKKATSAFSLLEMLVVIAIFSIIALALSSMLESTSVALIRTRDRVRQFSNARVAFDYMSRNMKQATLNTYLDYQYDPDDEEKVIPEGYTPMSDLQFKVAHTAELFEDTEKFQTHAVFFQAPLGASDRYTALSNLMNARGYFVEFGDDIGYRPDFFKDRVAPRHRYRLKEFRPPGEHNLIYKELKSGPESQPIPEFKEWFTPDSDLYSVDLPYYKVVRNVADNIVAMIVSPRISEKEAEKLGYERPEDYAPNYLYDSRIENPTGNKKEKSTHQLPPLIKLILISISEKSAVELQDKHDKAPPPEVKVGKSMFIDALKLDQDLATFEKQLRKHNIEYRIFQTVVGMQAAKWSDEK